MAYVKVFDDVVIKIWNEGFYFIYDKAKLWDVNNKRVLDELENGDVIDNPWYRDPTLYYSRCAISLLSNLDAVGISQKASEFYDEWKSLNATIRKDY